MADYRDGIKKEVAEIKFLIHDLRVERFINEIVHFHVTLNTDLEIYSIDQAQILHGEDLLALKAKAVGLRKAFQDYSNAVRSFSPDRTVLMVGKHYVDTIFDTCELILNPLWGRIDKVLTFLPGDSHSARSRAPYQNCIGWIRGVYNRILHFREEEEEKGLYEEFDVGTELHDFTRDVVSAYVAEKSSANATIEMEKPDSAVIGGNRYRFRRMYFNLVMNAVDAMDDTTEGLVRVTVAAEGDHVELTVTDNGAGMTPQKKLHLMKERQTLDGELDSLGFVFVRQTVKDFKAKLFIDSEVGKGTTVTVSIPCVSAEERANPATAVRAVQSVKPVAAKEKVGAPAEQSESVAGAALASVRGLIAGAKVRGAAPAAANTNLAAVAAESVDEPAAVVDAEPARTNDDKQRSCGRMIYCDYESSQAQFPGAIFAIAIDEDGRIDFFTHKPYGPHWNITHEDLAPMLYESTVRGRLEEDELKRPVLIFKPPSSVREYFDFKNVPERERSAEKHVQMLHDEYILIARKLIDTGLSSDTGVELAESLKWFPGQRRLAESEPFPLALLAEQVLTVEDAS